MKKTKSVSQLKKEADKWFSLAVRQRDADKEGICSCITCGAKKHWKLVQNGHFVTRSASALRYDSENCNAQCLGCNMFKSGEQYLYSVALDAKYGDGTAAKLMARRHETHKWSREELSQVIEDAKAEILFYNFPT